LKSTYAVEVYVRRWPPREPQHPSVDAKKFATNLIDKGVINTGA